MPRRVVSSLTVLALLLGALTALAANPTAPPARAAPAAASPPVDFTGHWTPSGGVGWTVVSEDAGGGCTGSSDASGYGFTGCQVSGGSYVFDVTYGSSYLSHNTGTISGDTLSGSFDDGRGPNPYTATRKPNAHDLAVAIRVTDPSGKPLTGDTSAVGKPALATVTLSAAATATAPLTSVTASPPAVTPSSALVETASTGPPPEGYTLQPGQSTSYTVSYRISGHGRATVAVEASGQENGNPQQATAQAVAQLSQPLAVSVTFLSDGVDLASSPVGVNAFRLADDDKGELPQDLTAAVTVTNTSGGDQDSVSVQPPDLSVADPASNHDPFPMSVVPPAGKPFPRDIGVLAAGASVKVTFTLHVTGNQDFRVSELVLSSDPALGDNEKSLGAGDLHALPTALLLVDLKPDMKIALHPVRIVQ